MRETLCKRPIVLKTTIGVLLAVSAALTFARGAEPGFASAPDLQDPAPPFASLDPASLDFGDQVVRRRTAAKRITVTNTGGKALYFDSVTVAGDNAGDFTLVKDSCTGVAVDPNKACVIDVTFTRSQTDERNASLKLTDNALDSPQQVSLTGNGINSNDMPPFGSYDPGMIDY
jgi:HYDIN/CFA65/VesB-like, Ig-like domain